jgi:hypothetical protein
MAQGHIATGEIGFFGGILRGRCRIGVQAMLGENIQYIQMADRTRRPSTLMLRFRERDQ